MQTPCPQPACADPSFRGHIGKRAIAIVPEQMRTRRLTSWKAFQPRTVDKNIVQPPVIVVIVESYSAAGCFQKIFIFVLAAEDGLDIKSRLARDIHNAHAEIRRSGYRGNGRRGLRSVAEQRSAGCGSREREDIFQCQHQRGTAQRLQECPPRRKQKCGTFPHWAALRPSTRLRAWVPHPWSLRVGLSLFAARVPIVGF